MTHDESPVDHDLSFVRVEEMGVVAVSIALAIITVVPIESLFYRRSRRVGGPQAPFAEGSGGVARALENFGESHGFIGDGPLTGENPAIA